MKSADPIVEKPRPDRGFSFTASVARTDRSVWILGIVLGVLYVTAIVILNFRQQYVDERFHFAQESLFFRGDWRLLPQLTTIPGYHAVLALIMRGLGTNTLDVTRVVHALLCLVAVGGFFALRRRLWPGTETIATAQFLCLPFMAPVLFILYTDVPAVALVLWATWFAVSGRTVISALLICVLVLFRQHEFLWAAFLAALVARPPGGWLDLRREWRASLIACLPFALPVFLFLAYWRWNGAISLSHVQALMHPDLSFHTGNVFLGLIVAGLLMPLQTIKGVGQFSKNVRVRPWLIVAPILAFAAFWFTFRANNPFNGHFLAIYLRHFTPTRVCGGIIVACVVCSLWRVRLRPRGAGPFLALVTAIFLSASWLIELRYLIAPCALWLAMREHDSEGIEYATWALWLLLAVLMIWAAVTSAFFV